MMYRYILLSSVLLLGGLSTIAQEEVFFNDTNVDKKDIEIQKNVHGISIGTEFFGMLVIQHNLRNFPANIQYFREDRIAPTLSMHTFAGLNNDFNWARVTYIEGVATIGPPKTYYNLGMEVGTELRWHMGYRSRYMKDRITVNNDGWFLAVPLKFQTALLHQPNGAWILGWQPDFFQVDARLSVKSGFRHSFTPHFFIEGSLQYTPATFEFNKYGCNFSLSEKLRDMFQLELKAAYVFKK